MSEKWGKRKKLHGWEKMVREEKRLEGKKKGKALGREKKTDWRGSGERENSWLIKNIWKDEKDGQTHNERTMETRKENGQWK